MVCTCIPLSVCTKERSYLIGNDSHQVPSAGPQSLRCSTSSSQSIEVTWQAPPASEHNGIIHNYRLHYEMMAADEAVINNGHQIKTVDGLYATLTGLSAHSAYRMRIEAATRVGTGPFSASVTCLTDETGEFSE